MLKKKNKENNAVNHLGNATPGSGHDCFAIGGIYCEDIK